MTDSDIHALLGERLADVQGRITAACERVGRARAEVTLIAVTKTASIRVAERAFELGAGDLGESRPQELWNKAAALPQARWHFIGHLQRNKIERTIPLVSLVHSVDSERLLTALDAFGRARGQAVPVLLEVNCSRESAKGGLAVEEVPAISDRALSLSGIAFQGLMTMAAFSEDPQSARPAFAELRTIREQLRTRSGLELPHLSMGMSNDFEVAVEEGATLVRIGSTLFEGLG